MKQYKNVCLWVLVVSCLWMLACSEEEDSSKVEPVTLHGTVGGCHVIAGTENLTIGLFMYGSENELAHSDPLAAGATRFEFTVDATPDETFNGSMMSDGKTERITFNLLIYQDEGTAGYDGETILGTGNYKIIYFSDDYDADGAVKGYNFTYESAEAAYSQAFEGLQIDVTTSNCDGLDDDDDDEPNDDDDDDDAVQTSALVSGQLKGCLVENETENLRIGLFDEEQHELAASPVLSAGVHNWQINLSAPPSGDFVVTELENDVNLYTFAFFAYVDAEGDGYNGEDLLGASEYLVYYFDGPYNQNSAQEGYNYYSPKTPVQYNQRFEDLLVEVTSSDCE